MGGKGGQVIPLVRQTRGAGGGRGFKRARVVRRISWSVDKRKNDLREGRKGTQERSWIKTSKWAKTGKPDPSGKKRGQGKEKKKPWDGWERLGGNKDFGNQTFR